MSIQVWLFTRTPSLSSRMEDGARLLWDLYAHWGTMHPVKIAMRTHTKCAFFERHRFYSTFRSPVPVLDFYTAF